MDDKEKKVLIRLRTELASGIIVTDEFLDRLVQDGVLTQGMVEERVKESVSDREKMTTVLDMLPRRGPSAFQDLVRVLEEDYSWLAKRMKEVLKEEENNAKLGRGHGVARVHVDHDIRDDVNNFIHKQLGENKKVPLSNKKSIENALAAKIHRERTYWRDQLGDYETSLERHQFKVPNINLKLKRLCANFMRADSGGKAKNLSEMDDLEELEYHVEKLGFELEWYQETHRDCYITLNEVPSCGKPIVEVIREAIQMQEKRLAENVKRHELREEQFAMKIKDQSTQINELRDQNFALRRRLDEAITEKNNTECQLEDIVEEQREKDLKHEKELEELQQQLSELQEKTAPQKPQRSRNPSIGSNHGIGINVRGLAGRTGNAPASRTHSNRKWLPNNHGDKNLYANLRKSLDRINRQQ
ncbi:DNA ligase 1 [Lingula anatina]|uniref:DNA ligase 1 n=1 Tax=Lingula anatina TaxID=7574 RepID=A0A1S3JBN7_LINAN|nr:DNA ligase 1 [Lingula anatina]|eukprot:XP_013407601.1 DNA ligase 1 [Lingula anatina]